jgi:hypothetical protein
MDPGGTSTRYESTPVVDMPMDNYDLYLHGRLDPALDESVALVESVEVRGPEKGVSKMDNDLFSSSENGKTSSAAIQSYPSTGMFTLMLSLETHTPIHSRPC